MHFFQGSTRLNFDGIGSEDFEEVHIAPAGVQLFAAKVSLFGSCYRPRRVAAARLARLVYEARKPAFACAITNVFSNLLDEAYRFSNDADMSQPLLRELFGPSRDEIWRQLASEMNANYVEGDFWKRGKIQASHAGWLITLDEHGKYHHTRMRAPFLNPGGFRFTVYRKGIFSELGKYLGMQDVEVGHQDFDRDFVIKGTDDTKLRQIFGNARIRELIAAQPQIHFEIKDANGIFERNLFAGKPAEDLDVLEFLIDRRPSIKDKEHLRLLFDLFAETLDELCRMGTARSAQAK